MPEHLVKRSVVFASLVASLMGAGWAATAHASDASEAEDLIRTAVKLRNEGKDQKAFPLLQRAYDLARTPRTEAQLGLVEMALGYWVESEGHLAHAVAATENHWIASNRPVLTNA